MTEQPLIQIVPYDASWKQEFLALAAPLRQQLQRLALRIDHIGSTAVEGVASKDRIDIQVTVASEGDLPATKIALEQLGYREASHILLDHIPPDGPFEESQWQKRFFRAPANQRPTNLHVRIYGRANQRYALLFRDYLRRHPSAAAAYAEAKRKIAYYHGDDSQAYCEIKDPICDIIATAALAWAHMNEWVPPPTDA